MKRTIERHLCSYRNPKEKIPLKKLIEYAEKIVPIVDLINKMVMGEKSNRTTGQSNTMAYAIEALHDYPKYATGSSTRVSITFKIHQLLTK